MTESYKVFNRVAVVALAAASSITLFGCKKDEQYADADEYEKELDEWANASEKIASEHAAKYNEVVKSSKQNFMIPDKPNEFVQQIEDACYEVTKSLKKATDERGPVAPIRRKVTSARKNDPMYEIGKNRRIQKIRTSTIHVMVAKFECRAAAYGIDLVFLSPENTAMQSDGAVKLEMALDVQSRYFKEADKAVTLYNDRMHNGPLYPSGYEVGAEYPDAGYWMNSCEGVKKHHDSKVEKMDSVDFHMVKDLADEHDSYNQLEVLLKRIYERCVTKAPKPVSNPDELTWAYTSNMLESNALDFDPDYEKTVRRHSQLTLEVDHDGAEHSRASPENNAVYEGF